MLALYRANATGNDDRLELLPFQGEGWDGDGGDLHPVE
jgi:hypothetical protein